VGRRGVDQSVHRIEPQAVDMVIAEPQLRVVEDVAAHLGFVEVDGRAPGVGALGVQVRAVLGQVVAARSEVVVDDVLDDAESARVAGVDEALVGGRAAVGLLHRVPEHAVVAPVVGAVEAVDRQHLDEVDAEVDEVVEALDRRVERSLRGEGADVQLVDGAARELPAGPAGVGPGEGSRVVDGAHTVHPVGLPARTRVGQHGAAVDRVAVAFAVTRLAVGRPVASRRLERHDLAVDVQFDGRSRRCPDTVRGHRSSSTGASRATGYFSNRSASSRVPPG
jgi:hypothetical protein